MLNQIVKGKKKRPDNILLYGVEGVGKTTFAEGAPNPVFIGAENNDEIESARLPKPKSSADVFSQLDALLTQEHDYKTVVIDTIDSLENIIHDEILNKEPGKTMVTAMGGYGKAYEHALTQLSKIKSKLDELRDRGMNVIVMAHANKTKFDDQLLMNQFDTYELKLHKKASALFKETASCVLFANFKVLQTEKDGRHYAVGTGERRIFTEKRPGFEAKNRFNLPFEMPLNYKAVKDKINEFFDNGGDEAKSLIKEILQECKGNAELLNKVNPAIDKANGNLKELKKIQARLREVKG